MDQDLQSIASARRNAEEAFKAYQEFLGTDPSHIDSIVDAMARAVEPEAVGSNGGRGNRIRKC